MNPKVGYTIVGLFVLGLVGTLVTVVIWLGNMTEQQEYNTHATYFEESVSGLSVGANVTYRGVSVGRVLEIALDPNDPGRVRVILDIEEGTPVKEDTVAILTTQGITGIAHVELTGGTRESAWLEAQPGEQYPVITAGPSFFMRLDIAVTSMVSELSNTAAELSGVAEQIQLLLGENTREHIENVMSHVEQVTGAVAGRAEELADSLSGVATILNNTAEVSELLPGLVSRVGDTIGAAEEAAIAVRDAVGEVELVAAAITETVGSLEAILLQVQEDISIYSRNTPGQVDSLLVELHEVSLSLRRLGLDMERDPEMLILGRPDPPLGPGESSE
jgi:phospholipid/cholesterol/gamma-HCH transport system substrate-binding protein